MHESFYVTGTYLWSLVPAPCLLDVKMMTLAFLCPCPLFLRCVWRVAQDGFNLIFPFALRTQLIEEERVLRVLS